MVTVEFEYMPHNGKWWITRSVGKTFYKNTYHLEGVWSAMVKVYDHAEMKALYEALLDKGYAVAVQDGYGTEHKRLLVGN